VTLRSRALHLNTFTLVRNAIMLDIATLTFDGELMTPLGDETLASIAGGDGPGSWFFKKVGELLFDCLAGSLDNVISAATEGYEDAR
jgi:hypothetical protein